MTNKEHHLEFPGICAKCGKPWGEHITELAIDRHPEACKFVPLPGEIAKPTKRTEEETLQ